MRSTLTHEQAMMANSPEALAESRPPHSAAPVPATAPAAPSATDEQMPVAAVTLVWIVSVIWIALAIYSVHHLSERDILELLPIILMTGAFRRLKLGVYTSNSYMSLTVVGNLAAGMLFGIPGAVICSTASFLLGWTAAYRARKVLFNIGLQSLSNAVGTALFFAVDQLLPGHSALQQAPGALLAGAVCYVLESALMVLIISFSQGRRPRAVWDEQFQWLFLHWMGFGLLALGLASSYDAIGIVGLLAFASPALLMRYAMKQYLDHTAVSVEELRRRNEALTTANQEIEAMSARIQETYAGTLEALVSALDARDQETYGHSGRVSRFTVMLARQMGIVENSPQWYDIERGALLHDVGKIGVPDAILLKPGKLTDEEWVEMRKHPDIGREMLKDIPFLSGAAEIVGAHHERWDGKGYPLGLRGDDVPIGVRMFAVADTFDAMVTDRPYRRAQSYAECLAEITCCSGTQFDPSVVEALHAIYPQWIEAHRMEMKRSGKRLAVVA